MSESNGNSKTIPCKLLQYRMLEFNNLLSMFLITFSLFFLCFEKPNWDKNSCKKLPALQHVISLVQCVL